MTLEEIKLGQYVRSIGGSHGKIVHVRTDGPFRNDPAIYVEWVYGRDLAGEVMRGSSGYHGEARWGLELRVASEADYLQARDQLGWVPR